MVSRMSSADLVHRKGLGFALTVSRPPHLGFESAQELEELPAAVARKTLSDNLAGGDVQRREERGGAVAHVVVGVPLDLARSHGQHRLRAIERLDLALLVDAEYERALGRVEIEAYDVPAFSTNSGSDDSLKVSERCGCRPKACQMRWMVDGA